MVRALLDGDIVSYRCSVAVQQTRDWGGVEGTITNAPVACRNAINIARRWADWAGAKDITVCLSPKNGANFRRSIAAYKQERAVGKPLAYWEVVEALEQEFDCARIQSCEADDVMGILGSDPKTFKKHVIVSIDKDLRNVPCMLFNPIKREKILIKEFDADYNWMFQTLIGDRIDGYPGCPNYGPARATKLLDGAANLATMWKRVKWAYNNEGVSEVIALQQAQFARILRHADYNESEGTIKLWHPVKPKTFSLKDSKLIRT